MLEEWETCYEAMAGSRFFEGNEMRSSAMGSDTGREAFVGIGRVYHQDRTVILWSQGHERPVW